MADGMLPILKEAAQVPGLFKEIYGDLAKPGVTQVGKALSTVLGLGNTILWPLTLLNERARIALEKNLEKYREQLNSIPPEKISEVPPELGVPIAEKLSYVTDEQLSDLYINLLAKASTTDLAHTAHPSFVNVVNNLSPDEAVLLQHVRNDIPFIEVRLQKKDANEWRTLGRLLTGLEMAAKLSFPQNVVAYLSNFEGLGLIDIRHDILMVDPPAYERLEQQYRPGPEKSPHDQGTHELVFHRGKIELTPIWAALYLSMSHEAKCALTVSKVARIHEGWRKSTTSARRTASGSQGITIRKARAGPVGIRRPCSQCSSVRLLKPK